MLRAPLRGGVDHPVPPPPRPGLAPLRRAR
jgi:hypothetical protein